MAFPARMRGRRWRPPCEDLGWGDVTTEAFVDEEEPRRPSPRKAGGIVAGSCLELVFRASTRTLLEPWCRRAPPSIRETSSPSSPDEPGASLKASVWLELPAAAQRIATATARYVQAASASRARIVDTRKTTPGLRALEKYAIRTGGGANHRMNLSDGILVKDNHLVALRRQGIGLAEALRAARARVPHTQRMRWRWTRSSRSRPLWRRAGRDPITT